MFLYTVPLYRLVGLGPDHLRQWVSAVPLRIATKFAHRFGVGSGLKSDFPKLFSPTPKNLARKTRTFKDRCQLEARNFETLNMSKNDYQMFHLR